MKEDEAKQKICPQQLAAVTIASVTAVADGASQDAVAEIMSNCLCLGSACMMWETWEETERKNLPNDELPEGDGWKKVNTGPATSSWIRFIPTGSGDCGLKTKDLECGA